MGQVLLEQGVGQPEQHLIRAAVGWTNADSMLAGLAQGLCIYVP